MRAVIYCRVSKDKRDRASVQQQEDEARLAAAALGWTVVQVVVDNDVSASRHARREREFYPALLDLVRSGQIEVLVFWESSRGDRDNTRWSALLDLCRDQGVKIHVVDHHRTYDLSVARDWKSLADDGVNNAYASEETRDRVLRAVRAQAAEGKPHGKLAYGYRRVYTASGAFDAQLVHDEQAAIVRECGRRVAAGETLYAIAQDLNARGIPAPRGGKWLPNQVKRLVTNPRYVGLRVHQGKVVGDAAWDGILDHKVYADCVRLMADPRRKTVRDTSLKHVLSGALKATCGGRMRVLKARGYLTYTCFEDFCSAVRTTHVEEVVMQMIGARLEQPDVLERLAARGDQEAVGADGLARDLQSRLDGFVDSAARGDLTPAALARIEQQLLPQIQEAKSKAVLAPVPAQVRELAGPGAAERLALLTVGQQRFVLDHLVDLRLGATRRGVRFTYARLAPSRWKGDDRTWGEHWAAEDLL